MRRTANRTLIAELESAAADSTHDEFLRFLGGSYTFGEIRQAVEQAAVHLASLGVQSGDRVGIRLQNGPGWVVAWLAVLRLEAVAVPINYAYEVADLNHVLTDSGAKVIVTDEASSATVKATEAFGQGGLRIVVDLAAAHTGSADMLKPVSKIKPDSLANLQYTSGTTGFPKACMLQHSYWMKLGDIAATITQARRGDVTLTAQPFSYIDPQWNTAMCLLARIPLVIAPRFSASQFWSWVREEGVTFFYVLGTMPTLLYKQEPSPEDRNHRVRLVLCSGIPPALHQALEERWGAPWREAYGLTETGIDICVPADNADSVGSGIIGWPVASKQAKVVDAAGEPVPPGVEGELVVTGEPLMAGYWNRPDANREVLRDGWFHTGDVVVQREDGALRLVGRLKDMVRRGGENISAAEVENAANQHPAVVSSAVVAVPDELWGEQVKLIVQLKDGIAADRATAEEIHAQLAGRLARFKLPKYLAFVDEFPKTPSERIAKTRIPGHLDVAGPSIFEMN